MEYFFWWCGLSNWVGPAATCGVLGMWCQGWCPDTRRDKPRGWHLQKNTGRLATKYSAPQEGFYSEQHLVITTMGRQINLGDEGERTKGPRNPPKTAALAAEFRGKFFLQLKCKIYLLSTCMYFYHGSMGVCHKMYGKELLQMNLISRVVRYKSNGKVLRIQAIWTPKWASQQLPVAVAPGRVRGMFFPWARH